MLLTFCLSAADSTGCSRALFLQIWVFKYCYVLIEHLADGAAEPPVMDTGHAESVRNPPVGRRRGCCHRRRLALSSDRRHGGRRARHRAARCCCPPPWPSWDSAKRCWQAVNPVDAGIASIRGLGPYYLRRCCCALAGLRRHRVLLSRTLNLWRSSQNAIAPVVRGGLLQPRRRPASSCAASSSATNPAEARSAPPRAKMRAASSCARAWSTMSSSSCASANTSMRPRRSRSWLQRHSMPNTCRKDALLRRRAGTAAGKARRRSTPSAAR